MMFRFATFLTISGHKIAINPWQVQSVTPIQNYHRVTMADGSFWELDPKLSLGCILTDLEAGMEAGLNND